MISGHAGIRAKMRQIDRGWTWRWCLRHYVSNFSINFVTDWSMADCEKLLWSIAHDNIEGGGGH
ncbi:hypothetical protein LINPERHAP1_LOCUS1631 [Linum perenne]